MYQQKNIILEGADGLSIALDICYQPNATPRPVVIYVHGFNGFKDWGNFDMIAKQFAEAGFVFIKFNFSHNGTSPEQPEDFVDLESYGQNNYTKELFDLQVVIDWALSDEHKHASHIDETKLYLVGHSRGGGIVILKASEDARVGKIATWASVSECKTPWGSWNETRMREWKETGVQYYLNARTKQQLPLYYQLHEDYMENHERLDVQKAMNKLAIPVLICHGTKDEAVPVAKAAALKAAYPAAELFLVESDHVFGRRHPWDNDTLPEAMQQVADRTIAFFSEG